MQSPDIKTQPTKKVWLKHPLGIFTANNLDATNGVVIEGQTIIELVAKGQEPAVTVDEVFDARDYVITPGLINTHHHFYQTLTRCLPSAINKPLFPWLQSLYQVWQHITPEMLAAASQLAVLELMLSGATTVGDHHYVFSSNLENALGEQINALQTLGARLQLTRGSMSLGQSQGGLPPDSVVQDEDDILADCQAAIDKYHDQNTGAKIQIALAPCSPFSVTKQLMINTAAMAEQNNVLIHTHLAETEDENQFCLEKYQARPLDYLEDCGWLNERTWIAHGIYFNEEEIKRLGRHRVGIAHCPSSNMLLASGICPTLELEDAGCRLGLAVDGSASNDCSNMIQEVRQSLLQQRLRYSAETITPEKVLQWATRGGADIYHRSDIGQLAPGMQADMALFKLDDLRFSGHGDPIAALVTCGAHQVEHLMVAGEWIIQSGEHKTIDKQALLCAHQSMAKALQSI